MGIASMAWEKPPGSRRTAASMAEASAAVRRPRCWDGAASPRAETLRAETLRAKTLRAEAFNSAIPPPSSLPFAMSALAARVGVEQPIKQMVLPDAVNSQVTPRKSLALEPGFLQE